jgi:HEAT repeat protein
VSFTWRAISLLILISLSAISPFAANDRSAPDPQEQAWQVLRTGLSHKRASERTVAVQALSLLPANRRATTFALHALRDEDVQVRAAAAVVVGQQHARSAIPALKDALNDTQVSVVMAAAHSLLLLKDKSAYDVYYAVLMGDRKSDKGLVQSQLDRLKDPKQLAQIGISEGMGFVPFGGMGYEAYRTIHSHNGSPARASAARFLAEDPDPISEDALLQAALADKDEDVRLAALDALAQRGDPHCIERLAKNLTDDKAAVRYRTASVIINLSRAQKSRKG